MRRIGMLIAAVLAIGSSACGGSGNAADQPRSEEASQAMDDSVEGSCAEAYSVDALARRAFAFDGTIVELTEEIDPNLGDDGSGIRPQPRARFEVAEWFAGGSGDEVWVWLQRKAALGERLLVSGEPRWGGNPLDDAIQWQCGWTIRYTEVDADAWRQATAT